MNNKINIPHERCLRIIYNDKTLSFVDLLAKDAILSINSVYHGSERNLVPYRLKELSSISSFKTEIKRWLPEFCPRVGYVRPIYLALVFCNSLQVT